MSSAAATDSTPAMHKLLVSLQTLGRIPVWVFQLLFRICVAFVFWDSGQTKIDSWQSTILLFENEYKVPVLSPEIAALLATTVELACPVLLVVGFGARLATLPMLAMTFVIEAFVYPEDWLQHLTWVSMLLFILSRGPGPVSVDYWIARKLFRSPNAL